MASRSPSHVHNRHHKTCFWLNVIVVVGAESKPVIQLQFNHKIGIAGPEHRTKRHMNELSVSYTKSLIQLARYYRSVRLVRTRIWFALCINFGAFACLQTVLNKIKWICSSENVCRTYNLADRPSATGIMHQERVANTKSYSWFIAFKRQLLI